MLILWQAVGPYAQATALWTDRPLPLWDQASGQTSEVWWRVNSCPKHLPFRLSS
jgi:hypothetical protein